MSADRDAVQRKIDTMMAKESIRLIQACGFNIQYACSEAKCQAGFTFQPKPRGFRGGRGNALPQQDWIRSFLHRWSDHIAAIVHENWLRDMSSDGWSYGVVMSQENKRHPRMRPFGALQEVDKGDQRRVVCESCLAIAEHGFFLIAIEAEDAIEEAIMRETSENPYDALTTVAEKMLEHVQGLEHISLPEGFTSVVRTAAVRTHDSWAADRMETGWA